MRLTRLIARNFRSLREIDISFDTLTVLIGENDAGKSSLLDLLDITLNNKRPDEKDFHQDATGQSATSIEVELEFILDLNDASAAQYAIDNILRIKKVFSSEAGDTYYFGRQPADEKLRRDFSKLNAEQQKALIEEIDRYALSNLTNATQRIEWLENHRDSCAQVDCWIPAPTRWGNFMPRFERYGAMDYNAPEGMVHKTLRQVFDQVIYETVTRSDGTVLKQPVKSLRELHSAANDKLQEKVSELLSFMRQYDLRVQEVRYDPVIDFANGLKHGEFMVDTGRGLHYLSKTGSGTRRRMFMATLDWDRQVSQQESTEYPGAGPNIIRGYDEPDSNLHFEAQRLMYQAITDVVNGANSRIQAILCTHSFSMIDRAPTKSIRKLNLNSFGCTEISKIDTDEDSEIERFLADIARELGITNSLIFYERCFVLVEGETEENALPIFYKRIYNRSLFEDGIRVINVRGNGSIKEFLKLLSKNRKELTMVFIDADARHQSVARLTEDVLRDAGFDEAFIGSSIIYVGLNEFEDLFPDDVLASCLNLHYPRASHHWSSSEIASLRAGKFSSMLKKHVTRSSGRPFKKPEFGKLIALHCTEPEIPGAVKTLFEKARNIARL